MVEAVGGSYSDHGRIAGSSGVPAIFGWTFHEKQWHGSDEGFADREGDVEAIYTTDSEDELRELIEKYSLTILVVGPREKAAYGNINFSLFDTLGHRIIEQGDYTVFNFNR